MRLKLYKVKSTDCLRHFLLFLAWLTVLVPVSLRSQEAITISWHSFNGTVRGPKIWNFPINRSDLLYDYRNNASMFDALDSLMRNNSVRTTVDTVYIMSAASPIAQADYNRSLSQRRAEVLRDYLIRKYGTDRNRFCISAPGIDWDGFRAIMERTLSFPHRKDILELLDSRYDENSKIWMIRNVGGEPVQQKLINEIYPQLQYVSVIFRFADGSYVSKNTGSSPLKQLLDERFPVISRDTVYIHHFHTDTIYEVKHSDDVKRKSLRPFAIKTNLLYDAALLPNLSVEFPISKSWSVAVNGAFSKWDTNSPRYWSHQINYAGLEARHWWNNDGNSGLLNGWFAGLYFTGGVYDLRLFTKSLDDYGYLSHWSWSAGFTGGYSLPLSGKLNLEFSFNAGYLTGEYHAYNRSRCKDCYPERKTGLLNYWGPTGAGVSLVYMIK